MTRRFVLLVLPYLASVGLAGGAHAAGAEPAPAVAAKGAAPLPAKLPPARPVDDILKDIVAALGGAEELGKHRSMHTKMSIAFQGLGISGTAEHYGAVGDKALTSTAIPNVASTREGSDGTRSWSQDPINGLRILTGVEAEQAHIEAVWNIELRFRELFPKIEARNDVAEDGTRVECLTLTPKLSPATTDCYDTRTHLLTSQRGVRSGPQGDTPFVARMKDWRSVAGTKVAFVTEMQVGPLSFVGTVTTAEMDVPVEASLFAVPEPAAAKEKAASGSGNKKARAAKPNKEAKEAPVRPE
ncbi:MAG TPA: hypothetical protein VGP07_08180 [Polyangia bacterium]|jgi:hypothetical protein